MLYELFRINFSKTNLKNALLFRFLWVDFCRLFIALIRDDAGVINALLMQYWCRFWSSPPRRPRNAFWRIIGGFCQFIKKRYLLHSICSLVCVGLVTVNISHNWMNYGMKICSVLSFFHSRTKELTPFHRNSSTRSPDVTHGSSFLSFSLSLVKQWMSRAHICCLNYSLSWNVHPKKAQC